MTAKQLLAMTVRDAVRIPGPTGNTLRVKRVSTTSWLAHDVADTRCRWGNAREMADDISRFRETGALPGPSPRSFA